MALKTKRKIENDTEGAPKKLKTDKPKKSPKVVAKKTEDKNASPKVTKSDKTPVKGGKFDSAKGPKGEKGKTFSKFTKGKPGAGKFTKPTAAGSKFPSNPNKKPETGAGEAPPDWKVFKKEKDELKIKRKQAKKGFDVIVQAKKLNEILRRKNLKGGDVERNKLLNQLHDMLKDQGHYISFVLAHDTARIVQWLLKYSSEHIRRQIAKELTPKTVDMLKSKYGVHCVKKLLKHGDNDTRKAVIDKLYGHIVKLVTHSISAQVVEYAYSTWATPLQKQHLVQEFFGDMYKNSKDDGIKSLKDVFVTSPDLKAAALGATKANLTKVLNKSLVDSQLVQTVAYQFLLECGTEDRNELISQLSPHIVVISNSKYGAKAAMHCIWHGTNKDRKVIMKTLKEHLLDLCKHEYGHGTVITLIDTADDTVLLNKIILGEILKNAKELSMNEWGRKVLLWTVDPESKTHFHPLFIKEMKEGLTSSTSKKSSEIRRNEILAYCSPVLVKLITSEPEFWLSKPNIALEALAILKTATNEQELKEVYESMVKVIIDENWKIKSENETTTVAIEEAGIHFVLKKLCQQDKENIKNNLPTFGEHLVEQLTKEVITFWTQYNRGCFFLVTVFENNSDDVQNKLKSLLKSQISFLKKQKNLGAQILLKKIT